VVLVTRLNGPGFALNPDLIEKVESTPDTVVTLVDGTKYLIEESVGELVELVLRYRALVVAKAGLLEYQLRAEVDSETGDDFGALHGRPSGSGQSARRRSGGLRQDGQTVVPLPQRER
jgi:flagellar protein FlbD